MKSTPLKFHGGKSYLAKLIVALMPPHLHYVETHFGSGAVLFERPEAMIEGHSEVANDVNSELANFWAVLADPAAFAEFVRAASVTPFSEHVFRKAADPNRPRLRDNVDRAVDMFALCRQSMAGRMDSFAPLSRNRTRQGMNEQVAAWLSAVEGLPDAHSRMIRVAVLDQDAVAVIRQQDGPNTLFYCDPPYLAEKRVSKKVYKKFEYTPEQHRELLETLSGISGKFILSGYGSEMYEAARVAGRWDRVDVRIDNKSSSKKTKEIKTESLWANFRFDLESLCPDLKKMIHHSETWIPAG